MSDKLQFVVSHVRYCPARDKLKFVGLRSCFGRIVGLLFVIVNSTPQVLLHFDRFPGAGIENLLQTHHAGAKQSSLFPSLLKLFLVLNVVRLSDLIEQKKSTHNHKDDNYYSDPVSSIHAGTFISASNIARTRSRSSNVSTPT